MKSRLILLLALAGACPASAADTPARPAAAAPATPAAPRLDPSLVPTLPFDSFRVIGQRNVFNPYRTGSSRGSDTPVPQGDTISLVGTMQYEKGLFAFFDGSDAAYRKALHVGDKLGDFTVKQIAASRVDLDQGGKPVAMRVGQQLRRPVGGEWGLIGEDILAREAQTQAQAAAGAKPDPNAPVAIPADASDVVRRMIENRNKLLKQ